MNLFLSDDEKKHLKSFVYDCWGDKDYEATIHRDWELLHDNRDWDRAEALKFLFCLNEIGFPVPPQSENLFFHIMSALEQGASRLKLREVLKHYPPKIVKPILMALGLRKNNNSSKIIRGILETFPNKVIKNVCNIFYGNNFCLVLSKASYMDQRTSFALATKKELNTTIKQISGHITQCNKSSYYPHIIIDSMNTALKLAITYRDFLDEELSNKVSRYTKYGKERNTLTNHEVWNDIILNIFTTLAEHTNPDNKFSHGEQKKMIHLITRLLEAAYPMFWGGPIAEKSVKNRIDKFSTSGRIHITVIQ